MSDSSLPDPKSNTPGLVSGGVAYSYNGFLSLQMMIDNSFYAVKTASDIPLDSELNITAYPALPEEIAAMKIGVRNGFLKNGSGVWMTLAFAITYFILISELVEEKETKIREAMKVKAI